MQEQYSVGIYARLSRDDERAGESVSIENQKEMLARYVREQGWTLYDYYCDDGVSGTTFDRPGFNRLVQDATDHKINLVLTKDLSYDALTAHVAIVFTRYMLLAMEQRQNEDQRTLGELFFFLVDEMADITFHRSLGILMDALMASLQEILNANFAKKLH